MAKNDDPGSSLEGPLMGMSRDEYDRVIESTKVMVRDGIIQRLAGKHGLHVLDVTWEDTARFDNSAVGPNISDMTIQVQHQLPGKNDYQLSCMPVIRYPNFTDVSGDIQMDEFFVLVGNECGNPLKKVNLRELLGNLREYLHTPGSWKGDRSSLLAGERDSHVLVSAQACFLPIPQDGIAEFNPVLFNYQSYEGNPAVLAILATREGTSVTVIDNTRDGFDTGSTWGQRLFFNQNGERASLTGQRKSNFESQTAEKVSSDSTMEAIPESGDGLNMVLLIQVPLKQKESQFRGLSDTCVLYSMAAPAGAGDVEDAVIGHGKVEGPFTEIDELEIERDDRFPVRVTVQFYKATSDGVVTERDIAEIADQIKRVYEQADYVGSLVLGGPSDRPTQHSGPHDEPPGWWDDFWKRHFVNTGRNREETIEILKRLLGENWRAASQDDAEQAMDESQQKHD